MKNLLLVMLTFLGHSTLALTQDISAAPATRFDEFYTVSEPTKSKSSELKTTVTTNEIIEIFWGSIEDTYALAVEIYSLMRFDYHQEPYGDVVEPYNRNKHFGTWISARPNFSCNNTRAQVLIRDSQVPVQMNPSGCTVVSGKWSDPYSGRDYTQAQDLQVDHFVALKNAYISGADKWTQKKRCLYSNYQGNKFHLIPVESAENMRKSDRTPERFMPTNSAYHCQYLAQWLKVKSIWALGLTPPEKDAVIKLVNQNHCTASDLTFTMQEMQAQRQYIADNMNLCN